MMKKIKGKVIRGKGIGRRQGYPTALLDVTWDGETGVFGAKVRVLDPFTPPLSLKGRGSWLPSVLIVGVEDGPSVEVHILDLDANLYGQTVEIEVGKKIRDIRRFANENDLKKQIEEDIAAARKIYEARPPA